MKLIFLSEEDNNQVVVLVYTELINDIAKQLVELV